MADSIFTKIIKREIPSFKVYEDDKTYAFLDIHPVSRGHTLVIPKLQIETVWDLPETDYTALMHTCQLVAKRLRDVLAVPYIGSQVVGEDVPHAHVHIIPFTTIAEFRNIPDPKAEPDFKKLEQLAQTLAF